MSFGNKLLQKAQNLKRKVLLLIYLNFHICSKTTSNLVANYHHFHELKIFKKPNYYS